MRRLLAALLLLVATALPAGAVSTTTVALTTAWTDLGAGPMQLQTNNQSQTLYQIGDAPPAAGAGGFFLQGIGVPQVVSTTSHVYVRAQSTAARGGAPAVTYAPVAVAGTGASGPATITPRALTFTHNEQVLALGGTYTVAADSTIKYVDVEVTGTGALRYSVDATAASATHGKPLNGAASVAAPQGGGFTYETTAVPQGPITFYAIAATSVEITLGR